MPFFRKKPVVIRAVQWLGDNFADVAQLGGNIMGPYGQSETPHLEIVTLEGRMMASIGDWIIRGVKGEVYPCKPDIFSATYEAVDFDADERQDRSGEAPAFLPSDGRSA